ncbi:DUF2306 domain-containing protein [Kitasatospora sp. NPDC054768]|uniref:DUF2306 domain-containing protein n=1 Tax=Kitasatospora sp. NBC_01519 TaxID=2903576 RepID=UPI002F90AB20
MICQTRLSPGPAKDPTSPPRKAGSELHIALCLLAAAWLSTAARAYRTIRRGEVQAHRIWTIRNYAPTFAAVTLRLYLLTGLGL